MKQRSQAPIDLDGGGMRIGIVAARFNTSITERLVDGASRALEGYGVRPRDVDLRWVPGAFEVPVVLDRMANAGRYDALIAIACVVRGDTPHFDVVVDACARGCADVARGYGIAVGFGVLTTDDWAQAEERAGGAHGNKGEEAALAALETALVLRGL